MFRCAYTVLRTIRPISISVYNTARIISKDIRTFSSFKNQLLSTPLCSQQSLLANKQVLDISNTIVGVPTRSVTKFSLKRGKRKTVKAAVRRFFRLHWGGWIRPKVGRKKKLWKKSSAQKRRLRQHVLCNSTQSTLLDKMVTKCWKKPKYYVEDPYAPYHTREEFHITRRNPVTRN